MMPGLDISQAVSSCRATDGTGEGIVVGKIDRDIKASFVLGKRCIRNSPGRGKTKGRRKNCWQLHIHKFSGCAKIG